MTDARRIHELAKIVGKGRPDIRGCPDDYCVARCSTRSATSAADYILATLNWPAGDSSRPRWRTARSASTDLLPGIVNRLAQHDAPGTGGAGYTGATWFT